jgi:DNA primase
MSRGKISTELLHKIKDAVNILEVVGEHVVLRKSGANATGLCPFHSERSPSFSVHEGKGLYHCYGCKKSGDLFTFFMEIHGIGFPEAVEELAERAKIALPNDWFGGSSTDDPETQKRRKEAREKLHVLFKLNLFAMAFYRQQLQQLPAVDRYFRKRGVQGDLATNFRVGAAPAQWDALARHMTEKKAPLPQSVELGLIRPSTKNAPGSTGYFDLFRNRAMFPIIDMRGRVAGFGGRMMPQPEGAPGDDGPKYMNSPESPIFQKSKLAFGLFQAQKHIREKDELILVEGYFDVLALHAAGFENVVATCGTSLTPDHLALFRRFAKRVTVLFDGDKAGISATERAMEVGLDNGMILYGASLPEGLDPDELLFDQETGQSLPEGKERMAQILAASHPLLSTQLKVESQAATQGPEARTQALKKAAGWLRRYTDPVGREVWMEDVVKSLGVSRSLLSQAMGEPQRGASSSATVVANPGGGPKPAARPQPLPQPLSQPKAPAPTPAPAATGGASRPPHPFAPRANSSQSASQSGSRGAKTVRELKGGEKMLLQGLAKGGEFSELFAQIRTKLPPESTVADLFDYLPAREFVAALFTEPGKLERFRAMPESVLDDEMDAQVRSTLTEAWVSRDALFETEDFKMSLDKATGRLWARFSQRIKTALTDAEAKQDAGLHAELMKEYLDVQRKIKEFISFYDEA